MQIIIIPDSWYLVQQYCIYLYNIHFFFNPISPLSLSHTHSLTHTHKHTHSHSHSHTHTLLFSVRTCPTQSCQISDSIDLSHSSQASPACPYDSSIQMEMSMQQWCKNTDRENQSSGRKICPSATLSTINLTRTGLGTTWATVMKDGRLAAWTAHPSHARPGVECLLGLMARYASVCGY